MKKVEGREAKQNKTKRKLTISKSAANDNRHARQKLKQATSSNDITSILMIQAIKELF